MPCSQFVGVNGVEWCGVGTFMVARVAHVGSAMDQHEERPHRRATIKAHPSTFRPPSPLRSLSLFSFLNLTPMGCRDFAQNDQGLPCSHKKVTPWLFCAKIWPLVRKVPSGGDDDEQCHYNLDNIQALEHG